jgi:hypothetical protein
MVVPCAADDENARLSVRQPAMTYIDTTVTEGQTPGAVDVLANAGRVSAGVCRDGMGTFCPPL